MTHLDRNMTNLVESNNNNDDDYDAEVIEVIDSRSVGNQSQDKRTVVHSGGDLQDQPQESVARVSDGFGKPKTRISVFRLSQNTLFVLSND